MDLKEFIGLNKSKKSYWLTREYLKKCSNEPVFAGKKMPAAFFKVRNAFLKADETDLDNMYVFLDSIRSKRVIELGFLWHVAQEWNSMKKEEVNREVSNYQKYKMEELDAL